MGKSEPRKPTIGQKIASKYLDSSVYPVACWHIRGQKVIAAAIDRTIRRAFRDGVSAAYYQHGRTVAGVRKANELAAKYGAKL